MDILCLLTQEKKKEKELNGKLQQRVTLKRTHFCNTMWPLLSTTPKGVCFWIKYNYKIMGIFLNVIMQPDPPGHCFLDEDCGTGLLSCSPSIFMRASSKLCQSADIPH